MIHVNRPELEELCTGIFAALGIPPGEALDSAKILVAADARGIQSHGVARILRYVNGIKAGLIMGNITPRVLHETPVAMVMYGGAPWAFP
jgi:LDH2 family malate/lactate/ureidoglycolate dehydrogenase